MNILDLEMKPGKLLELNDCTRLHHCALLHVRVLHFGCTMELLGVFISFCFLKFFNYNDVVMSYRCDNCGKKQRKKITRAIYKPPNILTVVFQRYGKSCVGLK